MTKERKLARRALDDLELQVGRSIDEIRAYLAAEPEAEPVAWTNQDELDCLGNEVTCYMYAKPEFTEGDIPLYLHPPKPAEPEAEPKTWQGLKMHEVASLWSEALDPAYFARAIEQALKEKNTRPEPARKPMTSEEMEKQYEIDKEYFGESVMRAFYNGIRFAEKHHDIGGDDE